MEKNKNMIIHHSTSKETGHFLSEFSYQMVMVSNNDEKASLEVASHWTSDQKGFEIVYPPTKDRQYTYNVAPGGS